MLQDLAHIEASCHVDVEVGLLNRLEQSTICISTITTVGIAMLTLHQDEVFTIYCIYDPRDCLKQTSAAIVSVEDCTIFITERRDPGGHAR